MGRFEHGDGVGQVRAGRDADTTHFGRQGVGQVVTIQVQGGDHVVLGRTQQDLLKHGVGDGVFHHDVLAGVRVLELHPRTAVQQLGAELVTRDFVAPFFEGTFGELHDVAFVDDGHGAAIVVHGVLQGLAHQALGAFQGNRLDADAAILGEADLLDAHFLGEELDDLLGLGGASLPLDTGVDVFGVLAEDHHVDVAGLLHRAGHAFEPAYRTLANVQVQLLAQGDVQGADATTDRRGQRALDGNDVIANGFQGLFRQPGVLVVDLGGFLTGIDLHPGDLASTAVGLGNGGIHHLDHDRADVDADAVALDEGDDRVVRYIQGHICIDGDFVTDCRHLDLLVSHAELRFVVEPYCSASAYSSWAVIDHIFLSRKRVFISGRVSE
ncbi:hypothetical protein D3C84_482200 [compost metagenome]